MKKKVGIFLTSLLIICFGIWLYMQMPSSFLKDITYDEISTITVRDGSTGQIFTITEESDIAHIITTIQAAEFKKEKISLFYAGTLYTIHFYDEEGAEIESFIINSDETIRKDPFFYRAIIPLDGLTEYIRCLANSEE